MYMEPQSRLAPAAARMPFRAWLWEPVWCMVLKPSITAAATMAREPSSTLATLAAPAPFNSPKRRRPQRMPTSELVFQSGKAMARPTSRIAKTVSVLATAHNMPASTANGKICGCTNIWVPQVRRVFVFAPNLGYHEPQPEQNHTVRDLVHGNQHGKPDHEDGQRDEEMGVGEDTHEL